MNTQIDVLFITRLRLPRDAGSPEVYTPLRLKIGGYPATIPLLRLFAQGVEPSVALRELAQKISSKRFPPVLTPYYMADFLFRRGLAFRNIPCLETGMDDVADALHEGVGVVALSTTWLDGLEGGDQVREAATSIRKIAPKVVIVAGGVGARKGLRVRRLLEQGRMPDIGVEKLADDYLLIDAERDQVLDAVLVGEGGESTLAAIAERVRSGQTFSDVPDIAFPVDGEYRFTHETNAASDVNQEIVNWSHHIEDIDGGEVPIRTAVGCPFRCEFCDFTGLYSPRSRSIESLVSELRTLADAQPAPRRVFFTDDNVALNRKRLINLTKALIENDLQLSWRAFVRADTIDAEVADRMIESGCRECLLGIESGDPKILKNMKKRLDLERAVSAISLLDGRNINTQCTFVVGFPGEDAASIDRTIDFISSIPSGLSARAVHRYYLFRFFVAPLCPVASPESRERFGLKGIGEEWSHTTMDSEEAAAAVEEIFLRVRGPSHIYFELPPPEWTPAATRTVLETRDAIQKQGRAGGDVDLQRLLSVVLGAEGPNLSTP